MRYVLIDRVTSIEPGQALEAVKVFPLSDEAMASGLAFRPTVPACLLVEAMAQAGGTLLSAADPEEPGGLVLAKVENAAFKSAATAGERLFLRAEVLEDGEQAVRLQASIRTEDRQVADMTYFLARRSLGEDAAEAVDCDAFRRAHHERGRVLGIHGLVRQGGRP